MVQAGVRRTNSLDSLNGIWYNNNVLTTKEVFTYEQCEIKKYGDSQETH